MSQSPYITHKCHNVYEIWLLCVWFIYFSFHSNALLTCSLSFCCLSGLVCYQFGHNVLKCSLVKELLQTTMDSKTATKREELFGSVRIRHALWNGCTVCRHAETGEGGRGMACTSKEWKIGHVQSFWKRRLTNALVITTKWSGVASRQGAGAGESEHSRVTARVLVSVSSSTEYELSQFSNSYAPTVY